ncbi:hypothetical protein BJ875DRAFT_105864 [Amylocarpus encephaloides]|uniref:FAD-binding domain-containing protein n=1 Tax=Amylocarpus encephaloides TaxID=45428 RepID=A0A9P7YE29_9HELO|nr:hypothetical protein BJ875DRAFT_105864 [Amylocarpus encephaloides]
MSTLENPHGNSQHGRLRVVIVGGGVAGLTLAHCLHHNSIDFVLLEGRKEIAPQVGASIVVLPNGARILDQLGIFDHILDAIEPLSHGGLWTADGKELLEGDTPLLLRARTGYPLAFMERCKLLRVLSEDISDKSKLHTSKWVSAIEQDSNGVAVRCADGSEYTGDIVVGADGVHSPTRSFMLDHIENITPGATKKDRTSISAEYNCIFGISDRIDADLEAGRNHRTYAHDLSAMVFVGKEGKLYWFLFTKLDKRYYGEDIPKYNQEDAEATAQAFLNLQMTDSTTYGELWKTRTVFKMVSIEEGQQEHWTSDRIVCIGDAVHKTTINFGSGANTAIESAASLANSLSKLNKLAHPSLPQVSQSLESFYQKRHMRANLICDVSNDLTRVEALASLAHKIVALYVVPNAGDFFADLTCDAMVGAEMLDALPTPPRSLKATMPWNPESGVGKHESKLHRALRALPLLVVFIAAHFTMGAVLKQTRPIVTAAIESGKLNMGRGQSTPLVTSYTGLGFIDGGLSTLTAYFVSSLGSLDLENRAQLIALGSYLIPLQTVWMIEASRRGNFFTAISLCSTYFGLAYQSLGLGFVVPLYCFLHYLQCPLENYHAMDNRLTQISQVKTIIPAIVIGFVLPSILMMAVPGIEKRQWINGVVWQPFPLYTAILQRIFGFFVKDMTKMARVSNQLADLTYLRLAYAFAITLSFGVNVFARMASPVSLSQFFFGGLGNPNALVTFTEGTVKYFRYDQLLLSIAITIWVMLSFWDLKKAGKVKMHWLAIVLTYCILVVVGGPGATMVAMFAWREEALAYGSHQSKWLSGHQDAVQ